MFKRNQLLDLAIKVFVFCLPLLFIIQEFNSLICHFLKNQNDSRFLSARVAQTLFTPTFLVCLLHARQWFLTRVTFQTQSRKGTCSPRGDSKASMRNFSERAHIQDWAQSLACGECLMYSMLAGAFKGCLKCLQLFLNLSYRFYSFYWKTPLSPRQKKKKKKVVWQGPSCMGKFF